jgi:hypothetical protein
VEIQPFPVCALEIPCPSQAVRGIYAALRSDG